MSTITDTTEIAFDAIRQNARLIPHARTVPFAVGGYVNGAETSFIWTDTEWGMFPQSYQIRINVTGEGNRGNALDVETGDATPGDVEPWIISCRKSLDPLLVYCNRSNMAECISARNGAHTATGVYAFIWAATLDGTITDRAMTQFSQIRVGGPVIADVSLITDLRLLAAMTARIGKQ